MKEILHECVRYKDMDDSLKFFFTLLYGPCEVLGGDSDTETTTEFNIFVETGEIHDNQLKSSVFLHNTTSKLLVHTLTEF